MTLKFTWWRIGGLILTSLLLLFIYAQIATRILFTAVDFDEGYNLQVSYHLRNNPIDYSTFTGLFDSNITTGPSVLIPAALFINNQSSLYPRIILLVFVVLFFHICQTYLYTGQSQRIIFLILITLTPLFYFFSAHVMGELPGFVFLLASLISLANRHYISTGGFLALSILAKQVYVFGIPAVVLQFILIHFFSKYRRQTFSLNAGKIISGFLIVILLWYSYVLLAVRFSYYRFIQVINDNWQATRFLSQPKPELIDKRLEMLGYVFGVNGFIAAILILSACIYIIKKLKHNFTAIALTFFCLIYTLYFLFLGSTNWYRHFFPSILALIVVLPLGSSIVFAEKNKRHITLILTILFLLVGNIFVYQLNKSRTDTAKRILEQNLIFYREKSMPFTKIDTLLISQMETAAYIKNSLPQEDTIAGISWWNAPEMEYLSRRKIERDPFRTHVRYIITDYYGNLLGPNDYQYLSLIKNKTIIYGNEGYTIYSK